MWFCIRILGYYRILCPPMSRNGSYPRRSRNHSAARHCNSAGANCRVMAYTLTLERHGRTDALASVEPVVSVTARHNVWNIHPHSCIRVVVPNSPHMVWVDPGEGTSTCQVNRSTTVSIEPGSPRQESRAITTILLRLITDSRG